MVGIALGATTWGGYTPVSDGWPIGWHVALDLECGWVVVRATPDGRTWTLVPTRATGCDPFGGETRARAEQLQVALARLYPE